MNSVRVTIAQINTIVGDLAGNTEKILLCMDQAKKSVSDIIVFPELTITGYPPEDLLLKPHFIRENLRYLKIITKEARDLIVIVGFVNTLRGFCYNSAAVLVNRKKSFVYNKMHLPNYGVFDEKRYFKAGSGNAILKTKDFSFVINICEDIWVRDNAIERQILGQAHFLINLSASPYHLHKVDERRQALVRKIAILKMPVVYCNLIGGQDELVFDGNSIVLDKDGKPLAAAMPFEECLLSVDLPIDSKKIIKKRLGLAKVISIEYRARKKVDLPKKKLPTEMNKIEEVYRALLLGVQDYVRKNNFRKVTFGLSGGIDSALVACIAADALGHANVLAISMPSRYSSKDTQEDAVKICKNIGIRFTRIPIDNIFDTYINTLNTHFAGMDADITEENIQARIRGNILMAFSNKLGYLVLNTGNKSETSVGYCTLYGDMAGGFSVIKDVPKNLVYRLARHVNEGGNKNIIPESVFNRPPSAELRPDQKDQDTLPPYPLLDNIIDLYIEKDKSLGEIVNKIGNKDSVKRVLNMIDINEYKRRQAPPGIKITPKAFGKDRRMPITNRFMEARYEKDDG